MLIENFFNLHDFFTLLLSWNLGANILSYKIEITKTIDNPLTKRKEIQFRIDHPKSGTPNRYEVKQKLAAIETADEDLVYIKNIKTRFGARFVIGTAHIYEDKENADYFEPTYARIRNMPKDKRDEARKKIKPRNRHKRNEKKV